MGEELIKVGLKTVGSERTCGDPETQTTRKRDLVGRVEDGKGPK